MRISRRFSFQLEQSERLFESRKSFHKRFEQFESQVKSLIEQLEDHGQIPTGQTNNTAQIFSQIQKQFQSLVNSSANIGHELNELELSGVTKLELQSYQQRFESNRQRLTRFRSFSFRRNENFFVFRSSYEIILQKRIDLLKRLDEHLNRSNELRQRLQKITEELENRKTLKIHEIDQLRSQVKRLTDDLRTVQSESTVLDRLMEESNTTVIDSANNRSIFFTLETRAIQNLIDIIEGKVCFLPLTLSLELDELHRHDSLSSFSSFNVERKPRKSTKWSKNSLKHKRV